MLFSDNVTQPVDRVEVLKDELFSADQAEGWGGQGEKESNISLGWEG